MSDDYIKREDAKKAACELCDWYGFCGDGCKDHPIDDVPAADVVEVVRCKDCKYYNTVRIRGMDGEVHEVKHCNRFGLARKPNDYCSYGERRSE